MKGPMLLAPAGKDYLWGGEKLRTEYAKDVRGADGGPMRPLAETWECSAHPDGPSTLASGPFKGQLLPEMLAGHPEFLGTKITEAGGCELPVLIKFIDAREDLSVQVHPDDAYALEHGLDRGKTEMWYVLEAELGASLVCGFSHEVTAEQIENALAEGTLSRYLLKTEVFPGDVFYIPAGTIHAVGAGILLAEIQENSNTTYRVWDYGRIDPKTGRERDTHVSKALEVLDLGPGASLRQKPRKVDYSFGCSREILARCPYFETERVRSRLGFSFTVGEASFQVLLCTEGGGGISTDLMDRPLRFRKGDCIFIPAGTGRCHVLGQADLLKVRC